MKHLSIIDILFLIFVGIFVLVCIYEGVQLIQPYYSFLSAFLFFCCISGIYFIWKHGGISFLFSSSSFDLLRGKYFQHPLIGEASSFISQKKDILIYICFFILFFLFLTGFIFDSYAFLYYALIIFYALFFFLKLFGFQTEYTPLRSSFKNSNALRFFLITFGVFIVILALILNHYGIPQGERSSWYLVFGTVYLLGGMLLFFDWNISFHKVFSVYNSMSLLFISSLIVFLAIQNGFFSNTISPENGQGSESLSVTQESGNQENISQNSEGDIEIDETQSEQDVFSQETEILYELRQIAQEYSLEPGIALGSSGENVQNLQAVLGKLQYYTGEISGEFDEATRVALSDALKGECSWPESTRGIFGPQAKACIDSLSISVAVN